MVLQLMIMKNTIIFKWLLWFLLKLSFCMFLSNWWYCILFKLSFELKVSLTLLGNSSFKQNTKQLRFLFIYTFWLPGVLHVATYNIVQSLRTTRTIPVMEWNMWKKETNLINVLFVLNQRKRCKLQMNSLLVSQWSDLVMLITTFMVVEGKAE